MRAVAIVTGLALLVLGAAGCGDGDDTLTAGASAPGTPPPGGGGGGGGGGPIISSVQPSNVPSPGGVTITLIGSNFQSGAAVTVGNLIGTGTTVFPPGAITTVAPRANNGATGPQDVSVINPTAGIGTLTGGVVYVPVTAHTSVDTIIAVDADHDAGGVTHVAWQVAKAEGTTETRYARSTNGGLTWSTPTALQLTSNTVSRPKIGAGGSSVMVVWNETVGTTKQISHAYSTNSGISWSAASALLTNGGLEPDADVAVDGTGNVAIVFRIVGSVVPIGTPIHLRVMDGPAGGPYSSGLTLTSSTIVADPASIAADGTGNVLVAYTLTPLGGGTREIYTQRSTDGGGAFAAAVRVTNAAQTGLSPHAPHAELKGANALLAYLEDRLDAQGNTVTVVASGASTTFGGSWSTFATVLAGAVGLQRLSLRAAVSGTGALTIAWQTAQPGKVPEVRSALSLDGGKAWPSVVSRSGTPGASIGPTVVGGAGTLFVHVWADSPVGGTTTVLKIY